MKERISDFVQVAKRLGLILGTTMTVVAVQMGKVELCWALALAIALPVFVFLFRLVKRLANRVSFDKTTRPTAVQIRGEKLGRCAKTIFSTDLFGRMGSN